MTYKEILEQFKKDYPDLASKMEDYRPSGHMEIKIWFEDGSEERYGVGIGLVK